MSNHPIQVSINNLAFGGEGVARLDSGKVVFVPGAFPRDVVAIDIVQEQRSFARARIVEVITPSPDRVKPLCVESEHCGGCSFWALSTEAEWAAKQRSALESIARIAQVSLDDVTIESFSSPESTRYRRRVRLHRNAQGELGFFAPASHEVHPISDCLVTAPSLIEASKTLSHLLKDLSGEITLELGDEAIVAMIRPDDASKLSAPRDIARLINDAGLTAPLAGVRILPAGAFPGAKGSVDIGEIQYMLTVDGRALKLEAGVFTQANADVNETLIQWVNGQLAPAPKDQILELYSGWGNFAFGLAEHHANVTGFEVSPLAIKVGEQNIARLVKGSHGNVEFKERDLNRGIPKKHTRAGRYNKVLLDPPRSGAEKTLGGILELRPELLLYVSCSPPTLARDLKRLLRGGFRLQKLALFDMFPRTPHVEVAASLYLDQSL